MMLEEFMMMDCVCSDVCPITLEQRSVVSLLQSDGPEKYQEFIYKVRLNYQA